jgi:ABC-type multidrug transport system fused ATPase/permease subunit
MKAVNDTNPLLYLFGKVWQHSNNKKNIVKYWVLFLLAECIDTFLYPLLLAKIMDRVQNQGINKENINSLLVMLCLMFGTTILFWILHGPARCMELRNAFELRASYTKFLIGGVMRLPMQWHVDNHSGDTVDKIKSGREALYDFSSGSFQVIYAIMRLIASYTMLIYFSHTSVFIVTTMLIISISITICFDKVLVKQYDTLNKNDNRVSERIQDAIGNISTIIILRVQKHFFKSISEDIEKPYKLQIDNNRINELKWCLVAICSSITTVLVLGMHFWKISRSGQTIAISSIYLLLNYLSKIENLFFYFADRYGEITKQRSRVANVETISKQFGNERVVEHVLPKNWNQLNIKDLQFSYTGGREGEIHLEVDSITIQRGQKIAFIGHTGGGKTTMMRILRSLYHPQSIRLDVDGIPITDGFAGISDAIALIPQSPEIFASTVRDNITMHDDGVDEKCINKYAQMTCFDEVVSGLPNGLNSSTKEKGVNLSGGQQQRLAMARGLLASRDRDIILLDEQTSGLDKATEQEVCRRVFSGFSDKTIISIVHGLHLLPLFNTIFVFENGKIVGNGSYEELARTCPEFNRLLDAMNIVST